MLIRRPSRTLPCPQFLEQLDHPCRLKCSAHSSGVAPYLGSVTDRSAPRATSSSTIRVLFLLAAQWSGGARPSNPDGCARI